MVKTIFRFYNRNIYNIPWDDLDVKIDQSYLTLKWIDIKTNSFENEYRCIIFRKINFDPSNIQQWNKLVVDFKIRKVYFQFYSSRDIAAATAAEKKILTRFIDAWATSTISIIEFDVLWREAEQTVGANEDDRGNSVYLIKGATCTNRPHRGKVARDVKHTCASKVHHE